jgi:hypothetical protein
MLAVCDPDNQIARASWHEGGHAVVALHYGLPLREVLIRPDGTGATRYTRQFGLAEAEPWTVSAYAGGAAEFDAFGDWRAENSDLRAIERMMETMGLTWSDDKMDELRFTARRLVECHRARVSLVADALVRHRHLDAAGLRPYGPDPS